MEKNEPFAMKQFLQHTALLSLIIREKRDYLQVYSTPPTDAAIFKFSFFLKYQCNVCHSVPECGFEGLK